MMLLKKDKMIVKYILLFFERRCSLARCCRSQTALPIALQQLNSLARCSSLTALPVAAAKHPSPLQQPNSRARCKPCPLQQPNSLARCSSQTALPVAAA